MRDNGFGRIAQKNKEHFQQWALEVDSTVLKQNKIRKSECILKYLPKKLKKEHLRQLSRLTLSLILLILLGCSPGKHGLIQYKRGSYGIVADKIHKLNDSTVCAEKRMDFTALRGDTLLIYFKLED